MRRDGHLGFGPALGLLAALGLVATVVWGLFGIGGVPSGPSAPVSPPSPSTRPPSSSPAAARFTAGPAEPAFPIVTRTAAQLAGGHADLFVPLPGSAGRPRERFPLAVLLADPSVDVSQYEQVAHEIGAYGIAVLVSGRPSDVVLREARAWSASLERNRDDYLHGLVAPSVSFVVAHDGARLRPSTWRGVRAVALLTPDRRLAAPVGHAPTLAVCDRVTGESATCGVTPSDIAHVVVDHTVALSVTDQGRRGPRVVGEVTEARLRTIVAFARPTALWLLAHNGDRDARSAVEPLVR